MNAIILSGGDCSRISLTKSFIKIGSKTIIEETIDILNILFKDIIIVSNDVSKYSGLGVKAAVEDVIPYKGPLGGIYTGLSYSDTYSNFIIACDMPFIEPMIISLLLQHKDEYDVIVPEYNGFIEPLYAVYSKKCLDVILEHINKNDLKVINIFPELNVKKINCNKYSIAPNAFFNINTPGDLQQARIYSGLF